MSRPRHATVVAYLALFTALGGSAYAVGSGSSPASPVIRACYSTRTGAMRLLAAGSCRRSEQLLTWNERGRRGAVGARGPAGARGPQGPEGPPGGGGSADAYTKTQSDARYLGVSARAADSAKLGGAPAVDYLTTTGTAANASQLGGVPAAQYLQTGATASNSLALQGQPASAFALASLFGSPPATSSGSSSVPCTPGEVMLMAGASLPLNWRLANGDALLASSYPLLYAQILYAYGGPGAGNTFNLPDLRGAEPKGQGPAGVNYAICVTPS